MPAPVSPGQPPGTVLDYVERSGDGTGGLSVTATADGNGGAQQFIDGNPLLFSGNQWIKIEFGVPVAQAAANQAILFNLYDGTNDLGRFVDISSGSQVDFFGFIPRYLTPSNGTHTYHIRVWKTSGTALVIDDVGGAGKYMPAFYRVTVA